MIDERIAAFFGIANFAIGYMAGRQITMRLNLLNKKLRKQKMRQRR